jgi:hypothetical protein
VNRQASTLAEQEKTKSVVEIRTGQQDSLDASAAHRVL